MNRKILIAFIGVMGLCLNSSAQTTANASHTVSLTLNNTIDISFISGGSGINMAFNNANDYQNGVIAVNAASMRVRSNKNFNVTVKTASANFSSSTATLMPVQNVLWVKEINQSSFVNMSNTDQSLLTNQSRGIKIFGVTYKATPGFNYDGGTYTVTVIYTATQQ